MSRCASQDQAPNAQSAQERAKRRLKKGEWRTRVVTERGHHNAPHLGKNVARTRCTSTHHGTQQWPPRYFFMSWMRTSHGLGSHADRAKETIIAHVQRGLLLATASRRLQDTISSRRASAEARHLLTAAKKLCEESSGLDTQDERVRVAIESLSRALEAD